MDNILGELIVKLDIIVIDLKRMKKGSHFFDRTMSLLR
jgi:hypothetical protein